MLGAFAGWGEGGGDTSLSHLETVDSIADGLSDTFLKSRVLLNPWASNTPVRKPITSSLALSSSVSAIFEGRFTGIKLYSE